MKSNRQVWGAVLIVFGVLVLAGAVVQYLHPLSFISKQATDMVNEIGDNLPNLQFQGNNATEAGTQTFDTAHMTKLVLNNKAGTVHIKADPNAKQATVNYVKGLPLRANNDDAKQRFESFQVTLQGSGDTEHVDVKYDDNSSIFSKGYVNFDIVLPPTMAVDVQNNAGEVTTLGLASDVTVRVNAGKIEVDGFAGHAGLRTNAGAVSLTDGKNIKGIDAETNTGTVQVTLPTTANLALDASTDVGMVSCDFPLTVEKHLPGSSLRGSIGTGKDGTVTLRTNTGGITISKQ